MVDNEISMKLMQGNWNEVISLTKKAIEECEKIEKTGDSMAKEVYEGIMDFCKGKLANESELKLSRFESAIEKLRGRHPLLYRYAKIEVEKVNADMAGETERGKHLENVGDVFYDLASQKCFFLGNAVGYYARAEENYRLHGVERLAGVLFKKGIANFKHFEVRREDLAVFDLSEALESFQEAERIYRDRGKMLKAVECMSYEACCYGRFIPIETPEHAERFLRKVDTLVDEAKNILKKERGKEGMECLAMLHMLVGETYRDEISKRKKIRKTSLEKALRHFKEALEVNLELCDIENIPASREGIATCFGTLAHIDLKNSKQNLQLAIEEYETCVHEYKKAEDEVSTARVNMNCGVVLRELAFRGCENPKEILDKALQYFRIAEGIFGKYEFKEGVIGTKVASSMAYTNLAAHVPEKKDEYINISYRLSEEARGIMNEIER